MINFNLDIAQRKILIVGAGNVAKRRLKKILKSSKDIKINIVSPNFDREVKLIFARETNVKFFERKFRFSDLRNIDIVIACTNDKALNQEISKICYEKKIFVNNASDQSLSTMHFTSNIKINKIIELNLNTGGQSPFLSKIMRILVEKVLKKPLDKLIRSISYKGKIDNNREKELKSKINNSDIIKKVLKKGNNLFDDLIDK
ncbi:hypothetical protein CM15mP43_04620 [bacterium]|nr:NAD(P)-dependent oxidoreductase [Thermodesulfobacteriota bacterium]GIR28838.1 MAG: hypothetical protein CM15mP43_04620 [bacterium]|tara:strand:+ start:7223 stop:7828 length:606 start_codon:yes stop_codon:yes gene_type:complete